MTPEFIDRCVASAADLALFFTGSSDEAMLLALGEIRSNVQAQMAPILGADVADLFAQAFVAAVAGHRREIEAAGAMPRVLN